MKTQVLVSGLIGNFSVATKLAIAFILIIVLVMGILWLSNHSASGPKAM